MPTVSLKDQLKRLVELQTIDVEIYQFKRELEEKPRLLEESHRKYEEKKSGLKALEEKLKALQVERKSKELDLQASEIDLVKANSQLGLLKTNKEYQAKLTEIESLKADKSVVEEKILLLYDEVDSTSAAINKEKGFLTEEEKKYLTQKKQIEDTIAAIKEKLKILRDVRTQITPNVEKIFLSRYERILENKGGLAIAAVKGNSCGGCFMSITDQMINEIKIHERLVSCEMCARILYLEDDL